MSGVEILGAGLWKLGDVGLFGGVWGVEGLGQQPKIRHLSSNL